MTNEHEILEAVLGMKDDIGNLKGLMEGYASRLDEHTKTEQEQWAEIRSLKSGFERQKGAIKGIGTVLGLAGTCAGAVVTWFVKHR